MRLLKRLLATSVNRGGELKTWQIWVHDSIRHMAFRSFRACPIATTHPVRAFLFTFTPCRLFRASTARLYPRQRPGTRKPLPDDEVERRVQDICYRFRKKKKCSDEIDYDFKDVGNYRIPDEEIQYWYKEYRQLYHPELDKQFRSNDSNGPNREGSDQPSDSTNNEAK